MQKRTSSLSRSMTQIHHNAGVLFGNMYHHFVYINVLSVLEHKDNYVTRFVSRYWCQIDITVVMCQIKVHKMADNKCTVQVIYKFQLKFLIN
jgi:hypothetical protein